MYPSKPDIWDPGVQSDVVSLELALIVHQLVAV